MVKSSRGGKRASAKQEEEKKYNAYVPTFKGNNNLEKALDNGYRFYRGDDMARGGGRSYTRVANRLKEEGYKVRVFEDTTRVRGLHNFTILYKRK